MPAKLLAEGKRKERVKLEFDERLFPVDVPERLDFSRVEKDCEQLSRLIHEHPKEMNEFFEAAIKRHDFSAARNIGEKLGLNEQKFAANGGGLIWLVVAVVIIVVVCWPKKAH
jgi:hypothetical protein